MSTGVCAAVLYGHGGGDHVCALPRDVVASASSDCMVRFWRLDHAAIAVCCFQVLLHHSLTCVSELQGGLLASASHQNVHIWKTRTGASVSVLRGHSSIVSSVCVIAAARVGGEGEGDGSLVASASFDKTICISRVATGECLFYPISLFCVCVSLLHPSIRLSWTPSVIR